MQDYDYEKAKLVILEMTLSGCQEMMRRKVITNNVGIYVGYSKEVIPATGGTVKMSATTNVFSVISEYVERLFADTTKWNYPIRR